MDSERIQKDHDEYEAALTELQNETLHFVEQVSEDHSTTDVSEIKARPKNKIKAITSILENLELGKYSSLTHFLQIKDLAGVRVTCFCEDDLESFSTILEGELRQTYSNVIREDKGPGNNTGKSRPPYRAIHINFTKQVTHKGKIIQLPCEIQLRTILSNAWAELDRKYVYGKKPEGSNHELTDGVSIIMNGCEKIWTVVKKQSKNGNAAKNHAAIRKFAGQTQATLQTIKELTDKKALFKKWLDQHSNKANTGLDALNIITSMEVIVEVPNLHKEISRPRLKDAASKAPIRTFGWPIGVYLGNREEFKPTPDADGISAEISIKQADVGTHTSYDYWALKKDATFYLKKSLFEDDREKDSIFFDTRIIRITEVLMYIKNLYELLEVPQNTTIKITINHLGLSNKLLSSANKGRRLMGRYKININEVKKTIETTLESINSNPVEIVESFTKELFEQFDFFELERHVLEDIVTNYLNGKIV